MPFNTHTRLKYGVVRMLIGYSNLKVKEDGGNVRVQSISGR